MSPSQSRKHRGYATQRLVAQWFAKRGWPYAESTGAGRSGVDITGMPDLSCEVKATAGDVTGALLQAVRNAGHGLPFVVWRPNGYGPERITSWPVILPLDVFTQLLIDAGYGDEEATDQGDVADDGRNDDPWADGNRPAAGTDAETDPLQPFTEPCPGPCHCTLHAVNDHAHWVHP